MKRAYEGYVVKLCDLNSLLQWWWTICDDDIEIELSYVISLRLRRYDYCDALTWIG